MYEKMFQLQEEVFKALAHQKRIEIVQLLSSRPLSVSEMVEMLGLPQANLSQHLSIMRRAGLLKVSRCATKAYYQLTDPCVARLVLEVQGLLVSQGQLDKSAQRYFRQSDVLYPLVKDVVCGMRISIVHSNFYTTHRGRLYYFCASGCLEKFEKTPRKYLAKERVKSVKYE